MELIRPGSVLDVGCGRGWWARTFQEAGCTVVGVDGDYVMHPVIKTFVKVDLSEPKGMNFGEFDLAVSLEVAEHLPEEAADDFVGMLCRHANAVLFSAAIPYQPGAGHINCQWPSYWGDLFKSRGFEVSGALRGEFWNNSEVECWYAQNMLLAWSADLVETSEMFRFSTLDRTPRSIVHPQFWTDLRTTTPGESAEVIESDTQGVG